MATNHLELERCVRVVIISRELEARDQFFISRVKASWMSIELLVFISHTCIR